MEPLWVTGLTAVLHGFQTSTTQTPFSPPVAATLRTSTNLRIGRASEPRLQTAALADETLGKRGSPKFLPLGARASGRYDLTALRPALRSIGIAEHYRHTQCR